MGGNVDFLARIAELRAMATPPPQSTEEDREKSESAHMIWNAKNSEDAAHEIGKDIRE